MHPATADILQHFRHEHLPGHLAAISKPICELAHLMANTLDGPELTAGLRKLLEAKDCLVRAKVVATAPAAPPPLQTLAGELVDGEHSFEVKLYDTAGTYIGKTKAPRGSHQVSYEGRTYQVRAGFSDLFDELKG